jgi:hypothetical protein
MASKKATVRDVPGGKTDCVYTVHLDRRWRPDESVREEAPRRSLIIVAIRTLTVRRLRGELFLHSFRKIRAGESSRLITVPLPLPLWFPEAPRNHLPRLRPPLAPGTRQG